MGRRGKLTAAAILLLPTMILSGSYFTRHSRAAAATPAARGAQKKLSDKQLERAKVLYANNCALCHGADGRGQTAMGRAVAAPNLADAGWWKKTRPADKRLTASIRDGRGHMPPFKRQLSKPEIAALARLVRAFGGQ